MDKSLITIVIPTYQRPEHLFRKLYHFSLSQCDLPLHIYDSSTPDVVPENKKVVEKFSQRMLIEYRLLTPSTGYSQKIFLGVSSVSTPYVVVHSDDDYLNLRAVEKCVQFLENSRNFVSATGTTLQIMGSGAEPDLKQDVTLVARNDVRNDYDPLVRGRRTRDTTQDKITMYNVWRTEDFIEVLLPITKNPYKKYTEFMLAFLAAYKGPTKYLDELYEVRTLETTKSQRRQHSLPGFEQGISGALLDENFREDLVRFANASVSFILSQSPALDEASVKGQVVHLFLDRFVKRSRLTSERVDLCTLIANGGVGRMFRIAARARHLRLLWSPKNLMLFLRMLPVYGTSMTGAMLRKDPHFEYNIITLLSGKSSHSEAFRLMYAAFKKDPEQN